MPRRAIPLLFTILLLCTTLDARAGSRLQVVDPWVREGPPVARVLAAFMVLRNPTDRLLVVTAAESPRFGRVELHRSFEENGMMRMAPVERLEIPPGGQITLAPGGYHLMLFDPDQPPKAGEEIPLILHLAGGGRITVEAEVRRGGGEHHHHHH